MKLPLHETRHECTPKISSGSSSMEQTHLSKEWYQRLQQEIAKVTDRYKEFISLSQFNQNNTKGSKNEDYSKNLFDGLKAIFDRLDKGFQNILEHLKDLHNNDPTALDIKILDHISEMIMVATVIGVQQESVVEHIYRGECLQNAIGISENAIESLYQAAKYFYEQQLYEEASIAFTILSLLKPIQAIFWMGLGNSEYFLGRYKQAIMAYAIASQSDAQNPHYHIFTAHCHKALGNKSEALISLKLAELAPNDEVERREVKISIQPLIREIESM